MRGNFFGGLMRTLCITVLCAAAPIALAGEAGLATPKVFLEGIPYDLAVSPTGASDASTSISVPKLIVNDRVYQAQRKGDNWVFVEVIAQDTPTLALRLEVNNTVTSNVTVPVIPAWVSILPPLLAIGMALLLRSVLPALMLGLWLGAWAIEGMSGKGIFIGLFTSFEVYIANAVADFDHATIMLFTFMIAGMVGIISRNGGMRGIV